ncbi:S-(hydroxymethyl)glutathione synthase [Exophiala spinifera]|uniref:Putative glutathione-dependent formaldehyde-activating enzyme n=1 Tax=Exophiala spinifera TaxID=91928 RepID=A0A0D2BTX8_9EURO|nr:S-(hydroxymethyl)glutathione synthase [Exophiala spinifera]KIW14724.1 S-(hydroxymethyl)glutathione synthase [Exophiala spinifera]
MSRSLHPLIDNGLTKGNPDFSGGTLKCLCKTDPVEVKLKGNVLHQHACGCSQCWKPAGALFSIVAVIPDDQVEVTKNGNKLAIVDENATILRYACKDCGAHLYGPIKKDHAFKGLSFVHTELSDEKGWQEPQFAAFVSSLIEQGYPPEKMDEVRAKLKSVGLEPYDALSPPLMDALATFAAKKSGKLGKL